MYLCCLLLYMEGIAVFFDSLLSSACPYFGDENDDAANGYEPCANGY